MTNAISLFLAFAGGVAVGHTPGIVARYFWKRAPLSLATAILIAIGGCVAAVLAIVALNETYNAPGFVRVWASSIGISSILSVRTMTYRKYEHLVPLLKAMIEDPVTTEERRAAAKERLQQLERTASKRTPSRSFAYARRTQPASAHLTNPGDAIGGTGDNASRAISLRYWRLVVYVAGIAFALDVALMASGYRLLVDEEIARSELRVPDGWTLSPTIDCSYWTGRGVRVTRHAYGVGKGAVDECPFVLAAASTR